MSPPTNLLDNVIQDDENAELSKESTQSNVSEGPVTDPLATEGPTSPTSQPLSLEEQRSTREVDSNTDGDLPCE